MSTFQNAKTEILKCAWEQFPHVQKSRYWKYQKSENEKMFRVFPRIIVWADKQPMIAETWSTLDTLV